VAVLLRPTAPAAKVRFDAAQGLWLSWRGCREALSDRSPEPPFNPEICFQRDYCWPSRGLFKERSRGRRPRTLPKLPRPNPEKTSGRTSTTVAMLNGGLSRRAARSQSRRPRQNDQPVLHIGRFLEVHERWPRPAAAMPGAWIKKKKPA